MNENRKFGLLLGGVLLLITGYFAFKERFMPVVLMAALVLMVMALVYPRALIPVRIGWYKVGDVLGAVNTRVLLFLLYFLVITPLGLIMRLLGKDHLRISKRQKQRATYWEDASETKPGNMEQQF